MRGSVPQGWTSPQPTRFIRRRVREPNAGDFSSLKCNLLMKRGLRDGGIGFPAKWQGLIRAVGRGGQGEDVTDFPSVPSVLALAQVLLC